MINFCSPSDHHTQIPLTERHQKETLTSVTVRQLSSGHTRTSFNKEHCSITVSKARLYPLVLRQKRACLKCASRTSTDSRCHRNEFGRVG